MTFLDPLFDLTKTQSIAMQIAWFVMLLVLLALISGTIALLARLLIEDVFGPLVLKVRFRRDMRRELHAMELEREHEAQRRRALASLAAMVDEAHARRMGDRHGH